MGLRPSSCLLPLLLALSVPAALLVDAACTNLDPCVSQPDCTDCDEGDKVPDPENCRGYYRCTSGAPNTTPLSCPDGEVFNSETRLCEEGETCTECPVNHRCVYDCSVITNGKISSFTDCSKYFICVNGNPTLSFTCDGSTPFFDGNKCQADESHCCHCHPYCYTTDEQVADPLDCRRYYVCFGDETPTDTAKCPDGKYYDPILNRCSNQASCETQCTNVIGEDGCINPFTCLSIGYFPRCPSQCSPDYYYCSKATGEYQDYQSCSSGKVFHPTSHTCVSPSNCP